jgi:hypothetical protein
MKIDPRWNHVPLVLFETLNSFDDRFIYHSSTNSVIEIGEYKGGWVWHVLQDKCIIRCMSEVEQTMAEAKRKAIEWLDSNLV